MEEADQGVALVRSAEDSGHWMWLQPASRHIRVYHAGTLVADTVRALRVLEVGHTVRPPGLYLPRSALRCVLVPSSATPTYCPLKGTAQYHDLAGSDEQPAVTAIAWSYEEPVAGAARLAGLVAFRCDRVTVVDAPP